MVHIRENVEQHRILELHIGFHESFDPEHDEAVVIYVGMPVEKFAFRADTHGVQPETKLAEQVFREQRFRSFLIPLVLALHHGVQIRHYGIVIGFQLVVVGIVCDAEFGIEAGEQNFKRVNLRIVKIFIASEKVLEIGDVLRESGGFAECLGRVRIGFAPVVRPFFWLEWVYDIFTGHKIYIATAEVVAEILVFLLGIQADDRLSGHSRVGQNEF